MHLLELLILLSTTSSILTVNMAILAASTSPLLSDVYSAVNHSASEKNEVPCVVADVSIC